MNNRKLSLDYLKFISIIIIIIHHSHILENYLFHGYILVELFFMVSGYLLISKCQKMKKIEIFPIMIKRLKKIYPEYFFAWLLIFTVKLVGYQSFPYSSIFKMIAELLLIQNWFGIGGINYPAWYISVMILAEIVMLLIYKLTDKKKYIVVSIMLVLLVYGFFISSSPTKIEVWETKMYVFYIPFWRGLADMMLGGLIYYVSSFLKGKLNKVFINISYFGLLCILFSLLCIQVNTDYICVALIWMIVLLSTFDNNVLNKCNKVKLHSFILKYQYGLFLNHACMILVFCKITKYWPNKISRLLVVLIGTIFGAILYTQFQRLIMKRLVKKVNY